VYFTQNSDLMLLRHNSTLQAAVAGKVAVVKFKTTDSVSAFNLTL